MIFIDGMNTENETSPKNKKRKHRPSVAIGLWIIKRVERLLMSFSKFNDQPFLDTSNFTWVESLEKNWQVIRAELDQIMEHPERIPNFQDISKESNEHNQR